MAAMTKEQYKKYYHTQINNLLLQLAKRNDETVGWWFHHELDKQYKKLWSICNICNVKILSSTKDHGLQHLREKNLLPFI